LIRALALSLLLAPAALATDVHPALIGQRFPDFELAALQGGPVSLASLAGRNVVVVVPRVRYGDGKWCTICNYGYAELAALDAARGFRKALDAEVVYLVPFGKEMTEAWIEATPEELAKIGGWKNPTEAEKADAGRMLLAQNARRLLSMDLSAEKGKVPKPFPILLDAERAVTGPLGLFATEWAGAKAEQGVPAVFVLDGKGIVRYKHVAQNTPWDRPDGTTILDVLASVRIKHSVDAAARDAIVAASLDYVEGWYKGDAERMRRALHPDLAKRRVDPGPTLRSMTAQDLIANPRARPLDRRILVEVLDVDGDLATVKIVSPLFVDYAHLALWNGQWKVINVLWR
jgi:peroxiredoxin